MVSHKTILVTFGVWLQIEGRWLGQRGWVEGAAAGTDFSFGEDGGHDRQKILVFVEVERCGGGGFVERVEEVGVVWAEGELVDVVREVEGVVVEV